VWPKVEKAASDGGEATVSITPSRVLISGIYNPKTKNMAWWPEKAQAEAKSGESIQVARPNKPAVILRDNATWDMLNKSGLFKMWMSTTPGRTKKVSFDGELGGGRRGSFSATLEAAGMGD
jgi:hypothetical protein